MFLWFFNKPAGEPEQEVREEQTQTHGSSRITETRHTLSSSLCDSSSAKANAFQGKSPTQCRRKEAARTRRVTSLIAYSLIRRGILHIKTSHLSRSGQSRTIGVSSESEIFAYNLPERSSPFTRLQNSFIHLYKRTQK